MGKRSGDIAPGIAWVTGGARGLGNAVAVAFAREGARGVVIVDIGEDDALNAGKAAVEEHGTKCLAIRADVTKEEDVQRAVQQAVAEFGRIDYAANFAGIGGTFRPIVDTDYDAWLETFAVNAHGVFLCNKHLMKQMISQDSIAVEHGRIPQRGAIVNCASVNSLQSMPSMGGYTATKHAVHGITKTAALEGREHGIRVNAVSPGFLRTKLLGPLLNDEVGRAVWKTFEDRQGRAATGFDEVGDVVVLMCSPRMSLVNGQNLFIDGGFTINESTGAAPS